MDGSSHLLSLKVMRISRPALASAWEPFYSSSPSLSAHSTASVMSLQGKMPFEGHPKTLRDLTHITEMLTLPSSFGAIQLGEMFTSCLCVNNEANTVIEAVSLKVEMQTATTKAALADFGGADFRLGPGDILEKVVHHEIKELGQHVLACSVSYRLPSGSRVAGSPIDAADTTLQTFRKFYKFAVTNPLSVKTKVHVPRAPTALFSRAEREKIFLEVHIQNLTQDGMWLERMQFECLEDWQLEDKIIGASDNMFSGSMALMQPQDMRQYIYVLIPKSSPPFPVLHAPGSIIPLGRLDISWRSMYGEPGRLLTSMLSRRIPLITQQQNTPTVPPKQPVSALPLHLQRNATVNTASLSRPRSPQLSQRLMSPPVSSGSPAPYRPGSPFKSRTIGPTQSLSQTIPSQTTPNSVLRRPREDVDVDLVVREIPRETISVDKPFKVTLTLTISAPVPVSRPGNARKLRALSLVVQHVQPSAASKSSPAGTIAAKPTNTESISPRLSSGFSTPSPSGTPSRGTFPDVLAERLLIAFPRQQGFDSDVDLELGRETPVPAGVRTQAAVVRLPPPFVHTEPGEEAKPANASNIVHMGNSALFLPAIKLVSPVVSPTHERNLSESTVSSEAESDAGDAEEKDFAVRMVASQDFELSYFPLRTGFTTIGGLRVLIVDDRLSDETIDTSPNDQVSTQGFKRETSDVRMLREWRVIGEVWIKT